MRNLDKNADKRFTATKSDTGRGTQKNKKALESFNKKLNKKKK